jgi:hypothetical protein
VFSFRFEGGGGDCSSAALTFGAHLPVIKNLMYQHEQFLVLILNYGLNSALALALCNLPSGRHSEETKRERPAGCRLSGENINQCQNIPHGSKGPVATGFINLLKPSGNFTYHQV